MDEIHTDNDEAQESENDERVSQNGQSPVKSLPDPAETVRSALHKDVKERSSALVKKWQKLVAEHQWQPSSSEAVDFFNSGLNDIHYSDLNSEDDAEERGSRPDSLRESRIPEQTVTIEHDELHLQPTRYQPAAYIPQPDNALLTLTSYSPVAVEEKIDDLSKLWSPEEDGLYVGAPPKCPAVKWSALERRLLAGDGAKWFRSDGSVAVLPDPLRAYLVRNVIQPLRSRYTPTKSSANDGGNRYGRQLDNVYPLHIFVSCLKFQHHWLFTDEDVLSSRLRTLWSSYCDEDPAKMDALVRKLRALYRAHDDAVELIDQLQFNGADPNVFNAQLKRIACYREAIAATREDYYALSGQRRRLVRELLAAWKELKALRKARGFGATRCRLIAKKGPADQTEAPLDWDEEVRRQIDESRRRHQEEVRADADRYRRQKAEWRARKKRLRKSRKQSNGSEVNDEEIVEEPEPPEEREFDEDEVREEIEKSMKEALAPPGEAPLKLSFVEDDKSLGGKPDAREESRSEALKKCCYQIKVYFNQEERASSDVFRLSEDFVANIQQAFNLWIREKPRCLSIHLLYKLNASNKKWSILAEIPLEIPSQSTGFASVKITELGFTSAVAYPPASDLGTVGSRSNQLDPNAQDGQVKGLLSCKVGWGTDSQGNIFAPNINIPQTRNENKSDKDWIQEIELDPNDPNNAQVFEKLEKLKRLESKGIAKDTSTVSTLEAADVFCSQEDLDSNIRFKVLQLRASDKKPYCLMSMVPSRTAEIPQNLQQMIAVGSAQSLQSQDDEENLNPLDAARSRGKRKIVSIYQNVADKLSASSQKKLNLADLVMEDHIPDMTTFGGQLMPLFFKPHRPLRPERKERTPVPFLAGLAIHSSDPIFLSVSVVRALNVPEKMEGTSSDDAKSTVTVHPFVEVTFQKQSARTTAGKGCSPTWNQELRLPVQFPEGSRSLAGLQSIQDDLFIQLFDEILVDILDDDRLKDLSIHQRYERHWLGGFRIPFQVVFKWSKIEGTFALNVPLAPIGYQYDKQNNNGPLLTVLISITPAISPPKIDLPNGPSMEDQSFIDHISTWRSQLLKEFPHLAAGMTPLVINDQGLSVYVGRYLNSLEPPEQLKGSDESETLKNLCQFAASIPAISHSHPNIPHVWLTCDTALKTMAAGDEERAVLLFSFLRALGYVAYVLLGMSIPHGDTAYILYQEKDSQTMRVINPSTGHSLDVKDSTSSLQQVWALFNETNFWANTQTRVHPSQLSYQVAKASYWRPLFSRRFPYPQLPSVQNPENIQFHNTSKKRIRQLEETIVEYIRQTFMKWRKTQRTKWNRHAGQVLRELLEKAAQDDPNSSSTNLEQLRETYKIFGVPLTTAYTDLESLSDMLFATGLHRHQGNEFALAVHIKAFPNDFLQVFLYCAYLESVS